MVGTEVPRSSGDGARGVLACVVLAHTDPVQVQRLVRALNPLPVVLHCDVSSPEPVFRAMTADLPERVEVMPRMATGWARWENVAAELEGYRRALARPEVTHVALMSGTDYPLAPTAAMNAFLGQHLGVSFAEYHRLPYAAWGPSGGMARLRYRHWVRGKRMLRLPVPRRLPRDVVWAGGSQMKVLSRQHAAAVVAAADERPDLVRFFRRSWIADESFVGSVLNTPHLTPGWAEDHVDESMWWISWGSARRKSPPWLTLDDLPTIVERLPAETNGGVPRTFARKFSTDVDTAVLDAIDAQLRAGSDGPW